MGSRNDHRVRQHRSQLPWVERGRWRMDADFLAIGEVLHKTRYFRLAVSTSIFEFPGWVQHIQFFWEIVQIYPLASRSTGADCKPHGA